MKKLGDPNLSNQEREKLLNRMIEASTKQTAEMQKAMDPNNMRQQQEKAAQDQVEFGCQHMSFTTSAEAVTGTVTTPPGTAGNVLGKLTVGSGPALVKVNPAGGTGIDEVPDRPNA